MFTLSLSLFLMRLPFNKRTETTVKNLVTDLLYAHGDEEERDESSDDEEEDGLHLADVWGGGGVHKVPLERPGGREEEKGEKG